MFERFTGAARTVVTRAGQSAVADAAPELGTGRLLLALTTDDGVVGAALADAGVTGPKIIGQLRAGVEHGLDTEALTDLGIDVDELRRRVEHDFGTGALEAAGATRPRRRRARAGGAVRFSPGSVRSLERALRTAVAAGSRELRSEHLLLGLLDGEDAALCRVLAGCGTSAAGVRRALDDRLGHPA